MMNDSSGNLYKFIRWTLLLLIVKLFSTLVVVFVFAKFSPLLDADLYLKGFYAADDHFRTRMVQGLVTILSKFVGGFFVHWIFGVFSLAGLIYYYWRGGGRWQVSLFLLLPSVMIWTSVIGKEALFYGAFTLALVIWTRFVADKCTVSDYIFLVVAVAVCAFLRTHYAVVVVWLFLSALLVIKLREGALVWLCIIAIVACAALSSFVWDELALRGYTAIDAGARASRFQAFGIEPSTESGFKSYRELLPLGGLFGIIGPMPAELIYRPIFIPFLIEGFFIFLAPFGVYFYANRQSFQGKDQFKMIFWMSLLPAIFSLIVLHAPFGLLNPGSATRWRVNFETAFYIAPLLLLYAFLDKNYRENNSLPP